MNFRQIFRNFLLFCCHFAFVCTIFATKKGMMKLNHQPFLLIILLEGNYFKPIFFAIFAGTASL